MCGINGFTFPNKSLIQKMNQRIKHRGPDDEGSYVDTGISLGNVRLAIQDLSPNGHMPMSDRAGRYWISFNGEIYNFPTLRKTLEKKYSFHSRSDTEVILYLYKEYGIEALRQLNGMFAIAIWDKKERQLLLARDRVGIKPLYYTITQDHQLIFSSEIKALLVHPLNKDIDPLALELYLRFQYVPAPKTLYKQVLKLEPGEWLGWKKGQLEKKCFWTLSRPTQRYSNKAELKDSLFQETKRAVREQLVADRPVGIFLSGGIDSNTVLALAAQATSKPLQTFSVGFKDVAEADKFNADFYLARLGAQRYQTDHHEMLVSPKEALQAFKTLVKTMDEPIANSTHISTYLLAQETTNHVKVVLGGDGGDELFGGYPRYLEAWLFDQYQRLPGHHYLNPLLRLLKPRASDDFTLHLNAQTPVEKYLIFMAQMESEIATIFKPNRAKVLSYLAPLRAYHLKTLPFYEQCLLIDFSHWLPEESLMRSDKMTMLWGLEQRVPLLDNTLVELANQIPFNWKVGFRAYKKIFRETFAPLLPTEILQAPKRGFFSPGAKWLRNPVWQPWVKELLSESALKKTGWLDPRNVTTMLEKHLTGERYNLHLLWAILSFQAWQLES